MKREDGTEAVAVDWVKDNVSLAHQESRKNNRVLKHLGDKNSKTCSHVGGQERIWARITPRFLISGPGLQMESSTEIRRLGVEPLRGSGDRVAVEITSLLNWRCP